MFAHQHNYKVMKGAVHLNEASIAKLRTFGDFQEDWNGYSGIPFDPDYLRRVEALLRELTAEAEVFPVGDGTVQIEFKNSKGAYLEVELYANGQAVFFEVDENDCEREYTGTWYAAPYTVELFIGG